MDDVGLRFLWIFERIGFKRKILLSMVLGLIRWKFRYEIRIEFFDLGDNLYEWFNTFA